MKYVVWMCVLDKKKKTHLPQSKVSPQFETREEAQAYLDENFQNTETVIYGVFKTDGNTGFY